MWEIYKSGSVRGIEVFSHGLNIVALLKPKGKSNRENKVNLNERTILCLLDKEIFGTNCGSFFGMKIAGH
jgi:hypothetical protein